MGWLTCDQKPFLLLLLSTATAPPPGAVGVACKEGVSSFSPTLRAQGVPQKFIMPVSCFVGGVSFGRISVMKKNPTHLKLSCFCKKMVLFSLQMYSQSKYAKYTFPHLKQILRIINSIITHLSGGSFCFQNSQAANANVRRSLPSPLLAFPGIPPIRLSINEWPMVGKQEKKGFRAVVTFF